MMFLVTAAEFVTYSRKVIRMLSQLFQSEPLWDTWFKTSKVNALVDAQSYPSIITSTRLVYYYISSIYLGHHIWSDHPNPWKRSSQSIKTRIDYKSFIFFPSPFSASPECPLNLSLSLSLDEFLLLASVAYKFCQHAKHQTYSVLFGTWHSRQAIASHF